MPGRFFGLYGTRNQYGPSRFFVSDGGADLVKLPLEKRLAEADNKRLDAKVGEETRFRHWIGCDGFRARGGLLDWLAIGSIVTMWAKSLAAMLPPPCVKRMALKWTQNRINRSAPKGPASTQLMRPNFLPGCMSALSNEGVFGGAVRSRQRDRPTQEIGLLNCAPKNDDGRTRKRSHRPALKVLR